MKKKINGTKALTIYLFIAAIFIIPALSWKDPAANNLVKTKWRGVILVPTPIDGMFEFKKTACCFTVMIVSLKLCRMKRKAIHCS